MKQCLIPKITKHEPNGYGEISDVLFRFIVCDYDEAEIRDLSNTYPNPNRFKRAVEETAALEALQEHIKVIQRGSRVFLKRVKNENRTN